MGIKTTSCSKPFIWNKIFFLLIVFVVTLSISPTSAVKAEDPANKNYKELYNDKYWKWDYSYQKAREDEKTGGTVDVTDMHDVMSEIANEYQRPPIMGTNQRHRGYLGNFLVEENDDVDGLAHRYDVPFYYHLDAARSYETNTSFWQVSDKAANMLETALNETVMMLNDSVFNINVTLSMLPVGALEMVDDFKFVGNAIDEIESKVQDMFGVGGGNTKENPPFLKNNGMFYAVAKTLVLFVVVYAFFQFVWKRSFISSFGEMGKFILVLAIGLLLIANYAPFLKGMNNISNELSMILVNQGSEDGAGTYRSQLDSFADKMWNMFVDAPYLSLQYGTESISEIEGTREAYINWVDNRKGAAFEKALTGDVGDLDEEEKHEGVSNHRRVVYLLTTPSFTPERKAMVKREAMVYGNGSMSYDGVNEKTILNIIYFISNAIMSIPFLVISLAILVTHFWFVLMALVAPFAFIVAAVPGQFNVLKRYMVELSLPLMVKIALHFIMLMIMFMHDIINETINSYDTGLFSGRIGEAFLRSLMYCLMFITVFFLRKRLAGLFTSGSTFFQEMRDGVGESMKPVQSTVTGVGTTVGAGAGLAVGAYAGMPLLGASTGMNLGGTAGSTLTGANSPAQGINSVASTGMHLAAQNQRKKQFSELSEMNEGGGASHNLNSHQPHDEGSIDAQSFDNEQAKAEGYANTMHYLEEEGLNDVEQDIYMDGLEENGIDLSKVSDETLDRNFTSDVMNAKGPARVRAQKLADNIKSDHAQQQATKMSIKDKRNADFDNYLSDQGMSQGEVNSLRSGLKNNGIDTAHVKKQELFDADSAVREKINNGENISYAYGMQKNLSSTVGNRMEKNKLSAEGSGKQQSKVPGPNKNNGLPTADLETPLNSEDVSTRSEADDIPPPPPPPTEPPPFDDDDNPFND